MSGDYAFLPDTATADLAFRARGETLEALFAASGEALLHAMVENPRAVEARRSEIIACAAADVEMLLFDLLQELIYHKDVSRLLLRPTSIAITAEAEGYRLDGRAEGEPLDEGRHEQGVDVKAVTLHGFRVERTDTGWEAEVILDV